MSSSNNSGIRKPSSGGGGARMTKDSLQVALQGVPGSQARDDERRRVEKQVQQQRELLQQQDQEAAMKRRAIQLGGGAGGNLPTSRNVNNSLMNAPPPHQYVGPATTTAGLGSGRGAQVPGIKSNWLSAQPSTGSSQLYAGSSLAAPPPKEDPPKAGARRKSLPPLSTSPDEDSPNPQGTVDSSGTVKTNSVLTPAELVAKLAKQAQHLNYAGPPVSGPPGGGGGQFNYNTALSSAAATSAAKPTVPKQPKGLNGVTYTLSWMGSSGSVFECLAKTLLRRPEWESVVVDTQRHEDTMPKDPNVALKKKLTKAQSAGAGGLKKQAGKQAVKPNSTNYVPCCDRMEPLNLFLGDKITSEEFIYDSRLTALRMRRMSRMLDPSALTAGARCNHRAPRADAAISTDQYNKLLNYFEGTRDITLKARMVRTLRNHLLTGYGGKQRLADVLPDTFVLHPAEHAIADEREDLRNRAQAKYSKLVEKKLQGRELALESLWIAKSSHGCHGDGIQLFPGSVDGIEDLIGFIDKQKDCHPWVIQKYVSRPLLVEGRKFDIRYWVLVTSDYKIYLHRRGVMRTSSEPYSSNKVSAHITNHCLQKESSNYSKYEKGNELWHDDLERLCDSRGREMHEKGHHRSKLNPTTTTTSGVGSAYSNSAAIADGKKKSSELPQKTFANYVLPQLQYITVESLRAVRPKVEDPAAYGSTIECFQLFGFDFITDENLKVQLLEVNGAPGVADKLNQIIVDDLVDLVIEPKFPTHLGQKRSKQHSGASATTSLSEKQQKHSTGGAFPNASHLKSHQSEPSRRNEFMDPIFPPVCLGNPVLSREMDQRLHPTLPEHVRNVLLYGDAKGGSSGLGGNSGSSGTLYQSAAADLARRTSVRGGFK